MLVYRVEDSNGMGPYNQTFANGYLTSVASRFREIHDDSEDHPALSKDVELKNKVLQSSGKFGIKTGFWIESTALFGFTSLSSMYAWFGQHLDMLKEGKFAVSVFEVPDDDVISSEKQAMFIADKEVLLKRIGV